MIAEGGPARRLAHCAAVVVSGLGCVLIAATNAAAAESGAPVAGYWWQPEPVSGLIPVPGVPPDGMYVASSPTGPQAVSAVRFGVTHPSGRVRLTLHVSMQQRIGKPSVIAYPASSRWQTGGPQAWSARPSYRASAKPARGVFSNNGTIMTLTFPAANAPTGMVLLPDPRATNKSFTIAFAPPRSGDVTVTSQATTSPSATPSNRPTTHRPTPSPDNSTHSQRPSSRPTHPHKTKRPTTHRPSPPRSTPGSLPSPTSGATAPSAAPASSGNGTAVVVGVSAAAVVAAVIGGVLVRRRRRS